MLLKNREGWKKTIWSMVFLVIGVFLGLVIVELSLRTFGFYVSHRYLFEKVEGKIPGELRILTLGESMTYSGEDPYPSQLERMLNDNPLVGRKVTVINGGVPGTATRDIVYNLKDNLDKYNPDIVVVMSGINSDSIVSYEEWAGIKKDEKTNDLKIFKLWKYLYKNLKIKLNGGLASIRGVSAYASDDDVEEILKMISAKVSTIDVDDEKTMTEEGKKIHRKLENNENKDQIYMDLSNYYVSMNDDAKVVASAYKVLLANPKNVWVYGRFSDLYLYLNLTKKQREALLLKAKLINPNEGYIYEALARVYLDNETSIAPDAIGLAKAIEAIKEGLVIDDRNNFLWYLLGKLYFQQGEYAEAKNALMKVINFEGNTSIQSEGYQLLAKIYQIENNKVESDKVLGTAAEVNDVLDNNLHIIAEELKKRGVVFIAMQYPLRDVGILKSILADTDALYVDNKTSFEKAVNEYGNDKIFVDLFAGDFGHCSVLGKKIMAENVAKVILELVL